MSLRGPGLSIYNRGRRPSLMGRVGRVGRVGRMERVGRVGWVGRLSKVSFNFLHTLWVHRLCIRLLIYEIKIVTNILMSFKISCQVGGRGQNFKNYYRYVTLKIWNIFSKLPYVRVFLKNQAKSI